jgi:DNA replication protein DnaC
LHYHPRQLPLPTVSAEYENVASRAAADNAARPTYPLRLLKLELFDREKRATKRRVKAAHLPTMNFPDEFDFTTRSSVNKVLVAELMRGEFIDKGENVLFVGNPGTGRPTLPPAARPTRTGVRCVSSR